MNSITFQDVYQTQQSSTDFKLGQRGMTPDGREWVYVNAAGAIGANLLAIPNTVTSVTASGAATSDNQSRLVYIPDSGASWTVGQFQDGIGCVVANTGAGQIFKIRTNSATQLTLYPETALATNIDATSTLSIQTMSYVLISAVTSTVQQTVGSPQVAFASADYGWLLTAGDGGVIASNTLVIGAGFTSGGTTAGQALVGVTAKGPYDAQNLGFCITANASAVATLVRFLIR